MLTNIVLDACNPGAMTGSGNHTYLLTSGHASVLVDAGVGHPDHLLALNRALIDTKSSLQIVLLTHGHSDHAGGVPAIAAAHPEARFAICRRIAEASYPADAGSSLWRELADGDDIRFGRASVEAIHTPGHSPDHLSFWHEPTRALYSGDLLIAGGSVMIESSRGGNLLQYLASLNRILELAPSTLFPAHGSRVDDPAALVQRYLAHRRMRERQVIDAIAAGRRTVEAIAESIYDGLDPRLMLAARENVRAHLEKLAVENVAADRDGWRIL